MRIARNTAVNFYEHLINQIIDVHETQLEYIIKWYDYRWNQCWGIVAGI